MIPSLRAGSVQRQPCSAMMWSIAQQQLAAAADRVRLRGGDPQLLDPRLAQPAVDLVDEPEVADREEQVGDLAAVEVGEVQAGAEDAPAGVALVLDDAAAQHADLDRVVEQHEIDRGLERRDRRVVLGVEVARVAQLDDPDASRAARRVALPRSTRPSRAARRGGPARAASGAASSRSGGARTRGRRARRRGTRPARSPGPALSFCSFSRSAATCSRVGRPGRGRRARRPGPPASARRQLGVEARASIAATLWACPRARSRCRPDAVLDDDGADDPAARVDLLASSAGTVGERSRQPSSSSS